MVAIKLSVTEETICCAKSVCSGDVRVHMGLVVRGSHFSAIANVHQ